MRRIFLATSPLHILISTLIAINFKRDACTLVICGKDSERNKQLSSLLSEWSDTPFDGLEALMHSESPQSFKSIINNIKPEQIISGNDTTPQFHSIINEAKHLNVELSYMDDGLHSYIEYEKKKPHLFNYVLNNIIRKIRNGYTKPYPHTIGSSPLTTSAYLLFPEMAKQSIQNKQCNKIKISKESKKVLSSLGGHCFSEMKIPAPSCSNFALFIIPHHSRVSNHVITELSTALEHSVQKGLTPFIKNHPSNNDAIIETISKCINTSIAIKEIPKALPIEIFICYNPPKYIVGGLSSIFLTSKALSDNIEYKIIFDELKQLPDKIEHFLKSKILSD